MVSIFMKVDSELEPTFGHPLDPTAVPEPGFVFGPTLVSLLGPTLDPTSVSVPDSTFLY